MLNIQIVYYVMSLYNISEIRDTDVIKINKQLRQIKHLKRCN